ncbi:MAG: glycosyltransferase [Candidatus Zixiibacteriota bacterium]|nr:MAG: glycosyltransferase [candidate division Zixibacteria bacterium]
MKKILLIAYHYHPDLQVGAQRTIKYVKYLPEFGWQPHVLSVDPEHYPQRDEAPLGFECPVYRTCQWPVPDDMYRSLKHRFFPSGPRPIEFLSSSPTREGGQSDFIKPVPWLKKFLNSLSGTPDGQSGWFVPAVYAAWRLIRRNKYDVIYSSGPPQTCHMVGYAARRLTGVPWVADFRDPWLHPKQRDRHVLRLSKRFDERYEAKTARYASLMITTTDEWRDHLKQLYHPLLEDKCHTIVNGFDEDDFDVTANRSASGTAGTITFLYAGNLYAGRDPSAMLNAAGELISEGCLKSGEVAFKFYGNYDIDLNRIEGIISEHGMHSAVEFHAPVVREQYLKLLRDAHVLILIQAASGKVHIPAKAFEYLGTGNAILTLTTEGATRNFMSGFDHVAIADLQDKNEIKSAIKRLVGQLRSHTARAQEKPQLEAITKRRLTEKFARLLDKISGG